MAERDVKGAQSFSKLPVGAKLFLGVGIAAAVSAVYYFALHLSLDDDLKTAQQRHAQLTQRLTAARARNAEYLELSRELASREGLDRANLLALPTEAEQASFLRDLNRLAELSGLEMRLVEPRPEEAEPHYVRLPVNLRLRGRYHQLARFFYNVSRLERLISMEDIHLSEPEQDAEEVTVEVDVLATTFRRPAAEAPAAPPAAANQGAGS